MSPNERDLRFLEASLQSLKRTLDGLQMQVGAMREQVASIDGEVRIRLSSLHEENQILQCMVDPYSSEGSSIVESRDY